MVVCENFFKGKAVYTWLSAGCVEKVGVMRMKQKKKLWLIVAALLLMLSFLFSRISISMDGIGGWVLLGMGGVFFVLAILLLVVRGRK